MKPHWFVSCDVFYYIYSVNPRENSVFSTYDDFKEMKEAFDGEVVTYE
jgi:hypothetical protein